MNKRTVSVKKNPWVSLSLLLFFLGALFPYTMASKKATGGKKESSFPTAVQALVRQFKLPPQDIGFVVQDKGGNTLYSWNGDQPFVPASNMKIFTSGVALHVLGGDFHYRTFFHYRGEIVRPQESKIAKSTPTPFAQALTLKGDLIIRGDGDPNISGRFHGEDELFLFRQIIHRIKDRGIAVIDGNILLDDTLFDRQWIHPDWKPEDESDWYEAQISALSFNDNCLEVGVRPAPNGEKKLEIEWRPPTAYATFENRILVKNCRRNALQFQRLPGTNTIILSGSACRGQRTAWDFVTIENPTLFFGTVFEEELKHEGINVTGKIEEVIHPIPILPGHVLGVLESSLADTITVMNKRSQNFYAEMLLKRLGAKLHGQGTWEKGVEVVDHFLKTSVTPAGSPLFNSFQMVDGSGLSQENRVTPDEIATFLEWMSQQAEFDSFLRSLSIAGQDGTLKHRFGDSPCRGRLYAKTGYLKGALSLSGYLFKSKPRWEEKSSQRQGVEDYPNFLVFSTLINARSAPRFKALQEHLCTLLDRSFFK